MKFKFIVALAASITTSIAFAQTSTSTNTNTDSTAPQTTAPSASTGTTANPAGEPTGTAAPAVAPATSTASLSANADEVKPRKVKFEFFTRTDVAKQDFQNGDNAPSSSNYVGAKFILAPTKSLSARQPFSFTYPKTGAKGKARIDDAYLSYSDAKIADLGNDISLSGVGRFYFPTGEGSRFVSKRNGLSLGWLTASKSINKFDIGLSVLGAYFIQSQDSYLNSKGTTIFTEDYELETWVDVGYNFTDKFSISQSLDFDNVFYRGAGTRDQYITNSTSISYVPMSGLSLAAVLKNSINVYNPSQDFKLYRDDELIYQFILSASL